MSKTRHKEILNHMIKCGHITKRDAAEDYDNYDLPKRISELVAKGFHIKKSQHNHKVTGKAYTRYSIKEGTPNSLEALAQEQRKPSKEQPEYPFNGRRA